MVGRRTIALLGSLLFSVSLSACDLSGEEPPQARISFPSALALSPDGAQLFVASSNYDLSYNSAALHSFDVPLLIERLEALCGPLAEAGREECGVLPIEDARTDLNDVTVEQVEGLLLGEVLIGSFADGLSVVERAEGLRLYLPVRSDGDLTWIDVDAAGQLDCGEGFSGPSARTRCQDEHRHADTTIGDAQGESVPADPVAVAAGELSDLRPGAEGRYVVMGHRSGEVSLFIDDDTNGPRYLDTLDTEIDEIVDVAIQPGTSTVWLSSAYDRVVGRAGLGVDDADPTRSYLANLDAWDVGDLDTGSSVYGDTRVIRFDPRADVERAYVLARRPRSLLIVDPNATGADLAVEAIVPVGVGASRLDVVDFPDVGRTLAFVSCYDDRSIWTIDVDSRELVGVTRNLGGAFELTTRVDSTTGAAHLFVSDFRTSVVRVLDLAPLFECLDDRDFAAPDDVSRECAPEFLGFLGRPTSVSELL